MLLIVAFLMYLLTFRDDFSVLVADKYMKIFDFSNVAIDESLRLVSLLC